MYNLLAAWEAVAFGIVNKLPSKPLETRKAMRLPVRNGRLKLHLARVAPGPIKAAPQGQFWG